MMLKTFIRRNAEDTTKYDVLQMYSLKLLEQCLEFEEASKKVQAWNLYVDEVVSKSKPEKVKQDE